MTLIKVKHPIFAPGESREVTGGPSPSTAAAPRVQGKPGGPHGRGGTDPTYLYGEQLQQPHPVLPQPAVPPPPRRCRPLWGASRGRTPRPARPPGPPPVRRGARSPAALCCSLLPAAAVGRAPARVPPAMGTVGGRDSPEGVSARPGGCSSGGITPPPSWHDGRCAGGFPAVAPPALTAAGHSLPCASPG